MEMFNVNLKNAEGEDITMSSVEKKSQFKVGYYYSCNEDKSNYYEVIKRMSNSVTIRQFGTHQVYHDVPIETDNDGNECIFSGLWCWFNAKNEIGKIGKSKQIVLIKLETSSPFHSPHSFSLLGEYNADYSEYYADRCSHICSEIDELTYYAALTELSVWELPVGYVIKEDEFGIFNVYRDGKYYPDGEGYADICCENRNMAVLCDSRNSTYLKKLFKLDIETGKKSSEDVKNGK